MNKGNHLRHIRSRHSVALIGQAQRIEVVSPAHLQHLVSHTQATGNVYSMQSEIIRSGNVGKLVCNHASSTFSRALPQVKICTRRISLGSQRLSSLRAWVFLINKSKCSCNAPRCCLTFRRCSLTFVSILTGAYWQSLQTAFSCNYLRRPVSTESKVATVTKGEDFMFSSVREATIRKLSNEYRKLSAKPALTETNAKTYLCCHKYQCENRTSTNTNITPAVRGCDICPI